MTEAEEELREIIQESPYYPAYENLPPEGKLRFVACVYQHRGDIVRAFENDFPSYCRDECALGEEGKMFCFHILCLLKGNDAHELVKTVGRSGMEDSGLLDAIDATNSRGDVERRVLHQDDWATMLHVQGMNLPEDNPFLACV